MSEKYYFKRGFLTNYDIANNYGISVSIINDIIKEYNIPHVQVSKNVLLIASALQKHIVKIANRIIGYG